MFNSILEYVVNADMYYRLWMAAEMQYPNEGTDRSKVTQPRVDWLPQLVDMFEDVRDVPGVIRTDNAKQLLDSELRFHTGNKTPTIRVPKMELYWGVTNLDVFTVLDSGHVITNPMRAAGPCKITYTNLRMWHHQNLIHRRRGDAIICDQIDFQWNSNRNSEGMFRTNGPFQVIIKNFRSGYTMGQRHNPRFDQCNVSWGNENGIRLGEERVAAVIKANDIGVDYMMCDSAFTDPGEEFIFWDEIGREQAA